MQHWLACLTCAGVALTAIPRAVMSSEPVHRPPGTVAIIVGGAPQKQYAHKGRWYVEALKGREYAIRLRNPYPVRVAVALSVDGLNTIDARQTTAAAARKWVLGPYETVTIRGWQTSRTEARRFEFTTEARSYGTALGAADNVGIISAAFFRERVRAVLHDDAGPRARRSGPQAPAPASPEESASAAMRKDGEELAATGMGRATSHAVTQVWLELEDTPAHQVDIRYEFRAQLTALGIVPDVRPTRPLDRRERAVGFEPGFSPVPPGR